ncbi:hypothetical protein FB451DRAFT_1197497 [Mycena latifolia]|nr:hypothetical protein FB451DRAFT_1197497 [Mycena latifolia]
MVNSPSVSFLSRQTLRESSSRLSVAVCNIHVELLSAAPGRQSTLDNDQLALRVLPKLPEIARASPINSDQSSSSLSGAVSNMYFELLSAAPGHQSMLDNNQLTLRVLPKPPEIARASPINSDQSSSRLSVAVPNMYLELLSAAPGRQSTLDNDQLALRVLPKLPEIARALSTLIRAARDSRGQCLPSILSFSPWPGAANRGSPITRLLPASALNRGRLPEFTEL